MAAGIDVLIEKPLASTLDEADELISLANANQRVVQVGHLERFNPAVRATLPLITKPMFFEVHRLSVFSPRSLDVDVVLDLMIHDIDVVLSFVNSPLKEIRAVGLPVVTEKVDIANVRMEFDSGCVANLTASRISTESVRKMRLFQPHQYLSLDYARRDLAIFSVGENRQIGFEQAQVAKAEPLMLQLDAFLDSMATRNPAKSSGRAARRTLEAALAILDKIKEHSQVVSQTLTSGWQ
jgi:predicted dehydrogenase